MENLSKKHEGNNANTLLSPVSLRKLTRYDLENNLYSIDEIKNCQTVRMNKDNYWLLELIYGDAASDTTAIFQIPANVKIRKL